MGSEERILSTQHVNEAPAKGPSYADEAEAFFQMAEAMGTQPRWRQITGVCEFDIDGAGVWRANIKKGVVTVSRGKGEPGEPPPRCVISGNAHDFMRLFHREGNLNIFAAILQELITVSGDIPFAWTILGGFVMNPQQKPTR